MAIAVSRRTWTIGGAVAAVIGPAVVLIMMLTGGGGPDVRLSAPAYIADPVPPAKTLTAGALPHGCGVGKATIRTYAPGADTTGGDLIGGCQWYSSSHDYHRERVLSVDSQDKAVAPAALGESADGNALRAMDPADVKRVAARHPEQPVSGLGDEALYDYSTASGTEVGTEDGATLRFRTGATVLTVTYTGHDFSGSGPARPVAGKEARAAVFAAATDIAKALHLPAKPALTATPADAVPPPAPRTVRPCDLVPRDLADRLAKGATHERPTDTSAKLTATYGLATDTCAWDAEPTCCLHQDTDDLPERHLTVTVSTESEWRRGIAVAQATRLYLEDHDDARAAATAGWTFHAVRGLGDQAYAAYRPMDATSSVGEGEVTFRYRDRVVQVGYHGADTSTSVEPDKHPLDQKSAVNGAYTAAVAVREALR